MERSVQATTRALARTLKVLYRWWVRNAEPVGPELYFSFLDHAAAWRYRVTPKADLDHPEAAATGGSISTSSRSRLHRHPERAVPEEAQAILAAGLVAHVGFVEQGQPYVIPMAYHYDPVAPRILYLHGGRASRLLRHLASGAPAAIAVTLVDGLVFSRTALYHTVNYRSVVCFAHAAPPLHREVAARVLEAIIARYFPGRAAGRDYAAPPPEHLDTTGVVALEIEEWSAKARRGGPLGPRDDEPDAPGSAGVLDFPVPS